MQKIKLMTHMVCGYPNISESEKIFKILAKYSEYIEIQFPFSDPIADGPVIEKANEIALEN
jgi:tryptophan synthase alpha chain